MVRVRAKMDLACDINAEYVVNCQTDFHLINYVTCVEPISNIHIIDLSLLRPGDFRKKPWWPRHSAMLMRVTGSTNNGTGHRQVLGKFSALVTRLAQTPRNNIE